MQHIKGIFMHIWLCKQGAVTFLPKYDEIRTFWTVEQLHPTVSAWDRRESSYTSRDWHFFYFFSSYLYTWDLRKNLKLLKATQNR